MIRKSYQVYHQAPGSTIWTRYSNIPSCDTQQQVQMLLDLHLGGQYKPQQLKPWLKSHTFKVAHVETKVSFVAEKRQTS